ncbi:MAG: AsmA-like C-terminal region-containing protein [Bryobacteraceae bacterium]
MKRLAWLCLAGLIAVVAAIAGSGYLIRSLLEGSGKDWVVAALAARAGVPVEVNSAEFDVAAWYRLRPSLVLGGIRLGNPQGFSGPSLLEARRLDVRLSLKPLFEKRIEVESLVLQAPVLTVERNRQGISNLEIFMQGLTGPPTEAAPGATASGAATLAIGGLRVEQGEVRLPDAVARAIDLELHDFVPGQACQVDLSMTPAAGSRVAFTGKLGPFSDGILGVDGELSADLALQSIPESTRRREFGELLASPGAGARVALTSTLRGDLYGALSGPARLTLRDVMTGRDGGAKLRLDGEVPIQASVRKALSTPLYDLRVRQGTLRMGGGEWKGNVDLLLVGGVVRGKSSGSIRNVDVDGFLSAFTRAAGSMQGVFSMPSYTLRFGGKDAAAIRHSLAGDGTVAVEKGRLKQLDLVASIRAVLEGVKSQSEGTEFTRLSSDLSIGGETLRFASIAMAGPALDASGAGSVTFSQALDFDLRTTVRGRVAELLGRKASEGAVAETSVPVRIGGTVGQPRVYPDLKRLARETGVQYAEKVVREKVLTEGVKQKVQEKLEGLKIPFPFGKKKDEQK